MGRIDSQIHWVRHECSNGIAAASQCDLLTNDKGDVDSWLWYLQCEL